MPLSINGKERGGYMSLKPLLKVENLTVSHKQNGSRFLAVSDVSFEIFRGETLALIGESGCGKSSIAKSILGICSQYRGNIYYEGEKIAKNRRLALPEVKKNIQMIFQDPYSSLSPRMTIEEIIKEPLLIYKIGNKISQNSRVDELLKAIGLPSHYKRRFPHELSGGERQRVSIARALASNPKLLVCDEPTHALDMSIQASIINLLKDLQKQYHLSLLFISHNLTLVKNLSDRCLVMYGGRIVEEGCILSIYENPLHPFTKKLLSSAILFTKHLPLYSREEPVANVEIKPLTIDSLAIQSYIQGAVRGNFFTYILKSLLQIFDKKKSKTECELKICPYFEKCSSRKYLCEKEPIYTKKIHNTHYVSCLLVDEKKSSLFITK